MEQSARSTAGDIATLIRDALTTAQNDDDGDVIRECGGPALALLPHHPDTALEFAYQKLHDVPYKDVKTCWRRLYTDAALWKTVTILDKEGEDWITEVVKTLDMALILTSAPGREELVEGVFMELERVLEKESGSRKRKRGEDESESVPERVVDRLDRVVELKFPIKRVEDLSFEAFQEKVGKVEGQTPLIITSASTHWPALTTHPWSSPAYLLTKTLSGRRLVPIELGSSYTSTTWTQKILPFATFLTTHILAPAKDTQTGYLAQHDLLAQIPSLRSDISIPDYVYTTPAPHDWSHIKSVERLEEPSLNSWFGPKGTVSPLHTDPYHNILAQVVGWKYVRLYAPSETQRLWPRGVERGGVDMSNTSQIDLDEAFRVFPRMDPLRACEEEGVGEDADVEESGRRRTEFEEKFPGFRDAAYVEGVLGPGECVYIPVGWWHYVRSLTASFSVSFWFN